MNLSSKQVQCHPQESVTSALSLRMLQATKVICRVEQGRVYFNSPRGADRPPGPRKAASGSMARNQGSADRGMVSAEEEAELADTSRPFGPGR